MRLKKQTIPNERPDPLIYTIRGQRVILDTDLAWLYGAPTFRFNEAFKRNRQRFPDDFAFQLTASEFACLKSQTPLAITQDVDNKHDEVNSSQIAMSSAQISKSNWSGSQFAASSSRRRGASYRPWAFTEHGARMAANILHSDRAIEMSVFVIRAFVRVREQLVANAAILKRLTEIDKTLLEHDAALRAVWTKLQPLLAPPPDPEPELPKRRTQGFNPEEERSRANPQFNSPLVERSSPS